MLLTVKAYYMFVAGGDSVSVLDSLSILLLLILILFVKSFNIKKKLMLDIQCSNIFSFVETLVSCYNMYSFEMAKHY